MRTLLIASLLVLTACGDSSTDPLDRFDDDAVPDGAVRDARVQGTDDAGPDRDMRVRLDAGARLDARAQDAEPDGPFIEPDGGPTCPDFVAELEPWTRPFDTPDLIDGDPAGHAAVEPVVNPGDNIVLHGYFSYGGWISREDLDRENVDLYLRFEDCGQWEKIERRKTDRDGIVDFELDRILPVGRYEFVMFVPGDGSRAEGAVWVVEPDTQAVVFDIDGTLTTSDSELFQEIFLGSEPDMYEDANTVVQRYAEQGYMRVYTTGRPYILNASSRQWLKDRGFPPGPIRTTDSRTQSLPTEDGVQAFKRTYLESLMNGPGLEFVAAYGNAHTDVCGYAQAGVDPAKTWIIGDNRGTACEGFDPTNAVVDYPSHLPLLNDLPLAQ